MNESTGDGTLPTVNRFLVVLIIIAEAGRNDGGVAGHQRRRLLIVIRTDAFPCWFCDNILLSHKQKQKTKNQHNHKAKNNRLPVVDKVDENPFEWCTQNNKEQKMTVDLIGVTSCDEWNSEERGKNTSEHVDVVCSNAVLVYVFPPACGKPRRKAIWNVTDLSKLVAAPKSLKMTRTSTRPPMLKHAYKPFNGIPQVRMLPAHFFLYSIKKKKLGLCWERSKQKRSCFSCSLVC